jgi:hypothetical protein
MSNGGRALVEQMVTDAESKIKDTAEVIAIMKMAGEDVNDEEELLSELRARVSRYRDALKGA